MEHDLKTWPGPFEAVKSGAKKFEARSNLDRDFNVGDVLVLRKWDPGVDDGVFVAPDGTHWRTLISADTIRARVTYILHGGRFGLNPGVCVMSIEVEACATECATQALEPVNHGGGAGSRTSGQ
jgi:hypothetical protein